MIYANRNNKNRQYNAVNRYVRSSFITKEKIAAVIEDWVNLNLTDAAIAQKHGLRTDEMGLIISLHYLNLKTNIKSPVTICLQSSINGPETAPGREIAA